MNLDLLLSIISALTSVVTLLKVINDTTTQKHQEGVIKYITNEFKVVINHILELITDIIKAFSDGMLNGIIDATKIIVESIVNFLKYLLDSTVRLVRFVFSREMVDFISKTIYLVLFLSTIWTGYFLYMGLINPSDIDYYSGISGMIVSVATMFSILVGFYEFRKK